MAVGIVDTERGMEKQSTLAEVAVFETKTLLLIKRPARSGPGGICA